MPDGIEIDATSGRVSGAASTAGVYVVALTATNGDGSSPEHIITIGIEESEWNDGIGIEVDIDLRTGEVTVPNTIAGSDGAKLFAKRGDVLFLDIGFTKDGVLQEIPITGMVMELQEFDGEKTLVVSSGVVKQLNDYDSTRYRIGVDFDSTDLSSVLSNYEGDKRTGFGAIAEIQWTMTGEFDVVLPESVNRTSQTFEVCIDRDLINP